MDTEARILALAGVLMTSVSCENWPLYSNLEETTLVSADGDIRLLYDIEWSSAYSEEPDGRPDMTQTIALTKGLGVTWMGNIEGVGWADDGNPSLIKSDDCMSEGAVHPLESGDYLGDLDYLLIDLAEEGTICARTETDGESIGYDLLLFPVDACDVPDTALMLPGFTEYLGLGLGGVLAEWSIFAPAGRYAVSLAGYYPNDLELTLDYTVSLSIVTGNGAQVKTPCPFDLDMVPE